MKIESYSFGRIVIEDREYRSDVIVFHNRVKSGWWRLEGHSLHEKDLDEILADRPSVLIVGKGAVGMMRIPRETESLLEKHGIVLIALRTGAAVEEYNKHSGDPKVIGAFHLTC